jgi:HK97 family phage prohead protease
MPFDLKREFGDRLVPLQGGGWGIHAGLHVEVREVTSDDLPLMDFVASDESVDRYNEVIRLDGWQLDNYRRNPVIVDSHDYSSIAKILGNSPLIDVREGRLINRVRFATDNPLGNMAWKMARAGFIKSQSVGFIPIDWQTGKNADEPARTYTKQELLEISLVAVPANPGATIGNALKSGAIQKSDVSELAQFLKQFCSNEADPRANARPSGARVHEGQLLPLARAGR